MGTLVDDKTIIKVAAIGDSITAGARSSNPETMSYPTKLQLMLGGSWNNALSLLLTPVQQKEIYYDVRNFGVSGRTMMRSGDFPYWNEEAFKESIDFNPDIVILMLGTNDSKIYQWNEKNSIKDYLDMLYIYKNLPPKPKIYMMIPPPLYESGAYDMNATVINKEFPEMILPLIAKKSNSDGGSNNGVILTDDIFYGMGGSERSKWQFFCDDQSCDSVHPNDAGYDYMAALVYGKIFQKPLPPMYYVPFEEKRTAAVA